jgi:hypothetical protein
MPAALLINDASGNVLVDTTTWCGHILGNFTLASPHSAGSIVNANLSRGRPFVIVLPSDGNPGAESGGNPIANTVTISGTTVSWNAAPEGCQVIYGIY